MIQAVFFDFDGLVLDTEYPFYQSWQEMFQEYGCSLALEDSANGIAAAKQAGLYCVAIPNRLTRHSCLDQADRIVNSLADVTLRQLIDDHVAHRSSRSGL